MRASLLALALAGCAYDYSNVPLADAGTPLPGTDAGMRFTCDPIVQTCSAMLHCGMVSDATAAISARCVIRGTGSASAPCDGPEDCALGYYCESTSSGSASCQSFCSDLSPACADGRRCATETVLFAVGAHVGHPCR